MILYFNFLNDFLTQVRFTNDDHSEDVVAIFTEYENFLKALLHNNISYLLELVGKTNPDVFQQFVKDVVAVEVNNLWKLDHQSLFRCFYYTCKYMHTFIHSAYITILFY